MIQQSSFSPRRSRAGSPKSAGLDIGALKGSGPHGRVVERDVQAAVASGARSSPAQAFAPAPSADVTKKFYVLDLYEEDSA